MKFKFNKNTVLNFFAPPPKILLWMPMPYSCGCPLKAFYNYNLITNFSHPLKPLFETNQMMVLLLVPLKFHF